MPTTPENQPFAQNQAGGLGLGFFLGGDTADNGGSNPDYGIILENNSGFILTETGGFILLE